MLVALAACHCLHMARKAEPLERLRFVPYYFKANRGGKGMSRVGLKEWVW